MTIGYNVSNMIIWGFLVLATRLVHVTLTELPYSCKDVEDHPNLALLAKESECGVPTDTSGVLSRIKGGERVGIRARPWMVNVYTPQFKSSSGSTGISCSGTLISRYHVLTAAHCFDNATHLNEVEVFVYHHHSSKDTDCYPDGECAPSAKLFKPSLVKVHESYVSGGGYYDIALIKLAQKVQYNDYVKPICLPTSCNLLEEDLTGKTVEAAGYGITGLVDPVQLPNGNYSFTSIKDNNLRKLSLTVGTMADNCPSQEGPSMMCAIDTQDPSSETRRACIGDSGGPLTYEVQVHEVTKHVQVGLLSLVYPCVTDQVAETLLDIPRHIVNASFYTRLAWFWDWILVHLSD